ncbi:MAG: hypothetical protein CMJ95_12800 [Planctomycetes bacterium]|nr:hypothetical protein [Planctomycetota bacterium]
MLDGWLKKVFVIGGVCAVATQRKIIIFYSKTNTKKNSRTQCGARFFLDTAFVTAPCEVLRM